MDLNTLLRGIKRVLELVENEDGSVDESLDLNAITHGINAAVSSSDARRPLQIFTGDAYQSKTHMLYVRKCKIAKTEHRKREEENADAAALEK